MLSKRMVLSFLYCFISHVAGDYDDEEKSKYILSAVPIGEYLINV